MIRKPVLSVLVAGATFFKMEQGMSEILPKAPPVPEELVLVHESVWIS